MKVKPAHSKYIVKNHELSSNLIIDLKDGTLVSIAIVIEYHKYQSYKWKQNVSIETVHLFTKERFSFQI